MATPQDASLGIAVESTYKTGVTPATFYEIVDENLDWNKNVVQGQGLRVGSRVARSARRVVPTADGGGDFTVELISKGMGKLFQACLGAGVSTLTTGSTYQHNFTLADAPSSLTIQKGSPEVGGTVDPVTYLGCMVSQWELSLPNGGIPTLKVTVDAGDVTTGTAYATPSYPASANLYQFGTTTASTGTLTAPTTTVMGSATTSMGDVRQVTISVNNNIRNDRFNFGGAGRKSKPTMGLREITGSIDIEYDVATWRDAMLNETETCLLFQYTAGALSSGLETFQVILPAVKFDQGTPNSNGNDLIVVTYPFTVLDNLTAAQPIYVSMRTADVTV